MHASLVPGSDVNGDKVVQIEFAPLFNLRGESGAEQSAAYFGGGAGQEDGGQLLPEASLSVLEQLVGLVHDQPLHTAHTTATGHFTTQHSSTDHPVSLTVQPR